MCVCIRIIIIFFLLFFFLFVCFLCVLYCYYLIAFQHKAPNKNQNQIYVTEKKIRSQSFFLLSISPFSTKARIETGFVIRISKKLCFVYPDYYYFCSTFQKRGSTRSRSSFCLCFFVCLFFGIVVMKQNQF